MIDLPEEIEEELGPPNYDFELTPHAVAQVFVEEEVRPFLTRRQVEQRLAGGFDKSTVNTRLSELVELDILGQDTHKNGTLYWLKHEDSAWPVPPDVDVEPIRDEPTVGEFFRRQPVKLSAFGIAANLFATILVWFGGLLGGSGFTIPIITPTVMIISGLLLIMVGWIFFGIGVFRYGQTYG